MSVFFHLFFHFLSEINSNSMKKLQNIYISLEANIFNVKIDLEENFIFLTAL